MTEWVCPYCGKEFWTLDGDDPAETAQEVIDHLEAHRATGHHPPPEKAS